MIKTFDLCIYMKNEDRFFTGLSRVAVKRYLDYYSNDINYNGYSTDLLKIR